MKYILLCLALLTVKANAYCNAWSPSTSTTITTVDIKVPVGTKAQQEIYRGPLTMPSTFPNSLCSDDTSVYGHVNYQAYDDPARFYGEIGGYPAYYLGKTGTQFAYTLIDDQSGLAYTNSNTGVKIPSQELKFIPRSTTLILYAAVDNPLGSSRMTDPLGMLHGGSYTGIGSSSYRYALHGSITQAPVYCTTNNTNLVITLNKISSNSFSDIGYPSDDVVGSENLIIDCTGDMVAEFKLMANSVALYNNKESIIKVDNENLESSARGVGFIISTLDGTIFENNKFVKIADLKRGQSIIPLNVRYYRYGNEVKAGNMTSSVSFQLQFN